MRIQEYEKIIHQAETDLPAADKKNRYGMHIAIVGVEQELTHALWQPGFREEARALAGRCWAILNETYYSL